MAPTYTGATKVEHSGALALLDVVAFFHGDLTRADFIHADADKAHEANVWVVCFHENDGSVKMSAPPEARSCQL